MKYLILVSLISLTFPEEVSPCEDSIYLNLNNITLDEMTEREFELFKIKDAQCADYKKAVSMYTFSEKEKTTRIGLGYQFMNVNIPLYSNSIYNEEIDGVGISIPIILKRMQFLIEPELDYFAYEYNTKNQDEDGEYKLNFTTNITNYSLSVNLIKFIQKNNLRILIGLRLGQNKVTKTYVAEDTDFESENYNLTYDYFLLSPILGAEYLLNDHFSFGTECHLINYESRERNQYSIYISGENSQKSYLDVYKTKSLTPRFIIRYYY